MPKKNLALESFLQRKFGPLGASITLFVLEVLQIILISSAIIVPIRYFLIQPFYVKGASMEPNFYDQEYLIIDELTYRTRSPERGEIVVFRYPRDPSQFFIKRVIGLPGETVQIEDGHVTLYTAEHPNGVLLTESYLGDVLTSGTKKVTLAANEFYVLGDNRGESMDSRIFGPVTRDHFIGRVWIRGLPVNRATTFPLPTYNL